MSYRSTFAATLVVFCFIICNAASADGLGDSEAIQTAEQLAAYDASIEQCQGAREAYRSAFDSVVSAERPDLRELAMSSYDQTYSFSKQLTGAMGGALPTHGSCSSLEELKSNAARLLAAIGAAPSEATEASDSSPAATTAEPAGQGSGEAGDRIVAALQMCPGAKAEVDGDKLFWEFDPADTESGIDESNRTYASLRQRPGYGLRQTSLSIGNMTTVGGDRMGPIQFLVFRCPGNCIDVQMEMRGTISEYPTSSVAIPLCNAQREFRVDADIVRQLFADVELWAESVGSNARVSSPL